MNVPINEVFGPAMTGIPKEMAETVEALTSEEMEIIRESLSDSLGKLKNVSQQLKAVYAGPLVQKAKDQHVVILRKLEQSNTLINSIHNLPKTSPLKKFSDK